SGMLARAPRLGCTVGGTWAVFARRTGAFATTRAWKGLSAGDRRVQRRADAENRVTVLRVEDLPPPRLAVSFVALREAFCEKLAQVVDETERRHGARSLQRLREARRVRHGRSLVVLVNRTIPLEEPPVKRHSLERRFRRVGERFAELPHRLAEGVRIGHC